MEHVPTRKIGDHVRIMDTPTNRYNGIANKRGIVVDIDKDEMWGGPVYIIKTDDTAEVVRVMPSGVSGI